MPVTTVSIDSSGDSGMPCHCLRVTTVTAVTTKKELEEKAMSYLVLHMDKFKKDAIRGIQSHNRRERESHSNPDIDYSRSVGNYDLHESTSDNYAQAIQNRIDDLLMVKAVRKDAVHMCGLIISSDKSFFTRMGKEENQTFFRGSRGLSHRFCRQGKTSSRQWFIWMKKRRTCTSFTCR